MNILLRLVFCTPCTSIYIYIKLQKYFFLFFILLHREEIQIEILKRMIEPPMSVTFDKISRTKFLQNSLQHLHSDAMQMFTLKLSEVIEENKYETDKVRELYVPPQAHSHLSMFSARLKLGCSWW